VRHGKDRNRQIIERRRSGEGFSTIGTGIGNLALTGSPDRRALGTAAEHVPKTDDPGPPPSPSKPIPCNCAARATCWPSCFGKPDFRPTTYHSWIIQLRCSNDPKLDCGMGKSLRRGLNARESRLHINAQRQASIPHILVIAFSGLGALPFQRTGFFVDGRSKPSNCFGEHVAVTDALT